MESPLFEIKPVQLVRLCVYTQGFLDAAVLPRASAEENGRKQVSSASGSCPCAWVFFLRDPRKQSYIFAGITYRSTKGERSRRRLRKRSKLGRGRQSLLFSPCKAVPYKFQDRSRQQQQYPQKRVGGGLVCREGERSLERSWSTVLPATSVAPLHRRPPSLLAPSRLYPQSPCRMRMPLRCCRPL